MSAYGMGSDKLVCTGWRLYLMSCRSSRSSRTVIAVIESCTASFGFYLSVMRSDGYRPSDPGVFPCNLFCSNSPSIRRFICPE